MLLATLSLLINMILPHPYDALHLGWMYRLLTAIADDAVLPLMLRFKGGTCAAMRGFIERFSVDLDFDLLEDAEMNIIRRHLEKVFQKVELQIADQSQKVPQYYLKYPSKPDQRNTLRLDVTNLSPRSNQYEPVRFPEIDRIFHCQTLATMIANKLVALGERFQRKGAIAARDVFDLHTFFSHGYRYEPSIVQERTGKSLSVVLMETIALVETHLNNTIIDQDLNTLLPVKNFHHIRKILKQEILTFLRIELERVNREAS